MLYYRIKIRNEEWLSALAKLMIPSETNCRDQSKKIYLVAGSGSQMVDTETNDGMKSEPDNTETTETNGEEKEKIQSPASDDRKIIDDPASDKGSEIRVKLSNISPDISH